MKQLQPLWQRLLGLFARAVVVSSLDTKQLQRLQLRSLAGETLDGIERLSNYGFASRPQPGAEAFVVFVNGDRSQGYVLVVEDRRSRPKDLVEGESCQFTDEGDRIHLKRGHICQITSGKFKFQGTTDELMNLFLQVAQQAHAVANAGAAATVTTPDGSFPLNNASAFSTAATALGALEAKITGLTA